MVEMLEFVYINFTLRDIPKELNQYMKKMYYKLFDLVTKNIIEKDKRMQSSPESKFLVIWIKFNKSPKTRTLLSNKLPKHVQVVHIDQVVLFGRKQANWGSETQRIRVAGHDHPFPKTLTRQLRRHSAGTRNQLRDRDLQVDEIRSGKRRPTSDAFLFAQLPRSVHRPLRRSDARWSAPPPGRPRRRCCSPCRPPD